MNGSEMIPLLPKDLDESDTSSEISAELENVPSRNIIDKINIENFTSENTEDFEQENVVESMNKLVDEEFETKLKIENNNKIFPQFESYEDEEAPLFEEIWKRPSDSENEPNLNQNKLFEQTAGTHSSKVPSDLVNDSDKILKGNKKKKHMAMRMAYQKTGARSEEQAFNVNMKQQMLIPDNNGSLIEEEAKSNSNLNLSTSSRSYRPGIPKSKSSAYSNHSGAVSASSSYQPLQYK